MSNERTSETDWRSETLEKIFRSGNKRKLAVHSTWISWELGSLGVSLFNSTGNSVYVCSLWPAYPSETEALTSVVGAEGAKRLLKEFNRQRAREAIQAYSKALTHTIPSATDYKNLCQYMGLNELLTDGLRLWIAPLDRVLASKTLTPREVYDTNVCALLKHHAEYFRPIKYVPEVHQTLGSILNLILEEFEANHLKEAILLVSEGTLL